MKQSVELQLKTDNPKSHWLAERIGGFSLFAFVGLGLLGVFGSGPISTRQVMMNGAGLTYPGVCRNQDNVELLLLLPPECDDLAVDSRIIEAFFIEDIVPRPTSEDTVRNAVRWHFDQQDKQSSWRLTVRGKPTHWGVVRGTIRLGGTREFRISILVLP